MVCKVLAHIAYTKKEMTLPPTIPTSFVPRATSTRRFNSDFSGAFGFFAYLVLIVAFVLALGVFFYGHILTSSKEAKDIELAKAQGEIKTETVENFARLRNRLSLGKTLLEKHTAFSTFFVSLEKILLTTVRFKTLSLSTDDTGVSTIKGTGVAKSFNALAAASNAFAADGHVKDAIFSSIGINKDNSVSFALSATLDPKIIAFLPDIAAMSAESTTTAPLP